MMDTKESGGVGIPQKAAGAHVPIMVFSKLVSATAMNRCGAAEHQQKAAHGQVKKYRGT